MSITVHSSGDKTIEITLKIELKDGTAMLDCEQQIQEALNQAGTEATAHCLELFDADGSPIHVGGIKMTSKGRVGKKYQTPYGETMVERYVYQSREGGETFCPLDQNARIVNSTTPRFAKVAAFKYASMKSTTAQEDLEKNHARKVSRCFLQDIAEDVAAILVQKEEHWHYEDPPLDGTVHTIGLGVDGTCVLFCEEGYRQTMAGTIALYDIEGERLHTTYLGAEPQYGKEDFYCRMEMEINQYKQRYPGTKWVGIADGAHDHWPWLKQFTDEQILDFFHATGYLKGAAQGVCTSIKDRSAWIDENAHNLKHKRGAAKKILNQMKEALENRRLGKVVKEELSRSVSYFKNYQGQMKYASYRKQNLPIGSGITEAACKSLAKQRMCGSGMKWKSRGASVILGLRGLTQTKGRWEQFWQKLSRFGF